MAVMATTTMAVMVAGAKHLFAATATSTQVRRSAAGFDFGSRLSAISEFFELTS
jgi:hypothetical protein